MDFVFIDDVARANIRAATRDVTDVVCNVASGVETTLDELAHTLIAAMGADVSPVHEPQVSENPVPRRVADTAVVKRSLGWHPEIDMQTGLERLVAWWRDSGGVEYAGLR